MAPASWPGFVRRGVAEFLGTTGRKRTKILLRGRTHSQDAPTLPGDLALGGVLQFDTGRVVATSCPRRDLLRETGAERGAKGWGTRGARALRCFLARGARSSGPLQPWPLRPKGGPGRSKSRAPVGL